MNIVESILFQCKLNPLALAIHVPGAPQGSVTYGMLERYIHSVARLAIQSGIAPGDIVGLYVEGDTVFHAALMFGLMHVGAVTVSMRSPRPVPGIAPVVVLTNAPGRIEGEATVLGVDRSWLDAYDAKEIVPSRGGDDDLCRIILTSGSTGDPKGVAFSHGVMGKRMLARSTLKGPRFAHCPRLFCDLGLTTSPGFHYSMSLLGRGGTIYFLGPDPADILQTINLHDIRGMATSPYGLGEFVKFYEADAAFSTTFDLIVCQGAMLTPELSRRARARLCQNLYSSYGSTETSTIALGPAAALERTPGAVGYIEPGVTVEVVDRSGKVLPAHTDGRLRIRNDKMGQGYFGDPEATAQYFRDGYFYTGDIGHVTEDRLLVITAREKTALNLGGDTISPERVESVIGAFPAIREAGVFAADNELGVAELHVLIAVDAPIDPEALRRHCAQRLSPSCILARIVVVDALPRAGQGKLERHRFPELAATGSRIA